MEGPAMILELIEDFTKLAVIVAGLYFVLGAYARHQRPTWSAPIEKRRLVILFALVLVVSAMKVSEDVLRGESGPVDEAILMFVHRHAPTALQGFFEAVTFTGSSWFLFPLAAAATIALLLAGRRFEALLIATSAIGGAIVVYLVKTVAGRERPELWETERYWGSSFPSGHTLVVAAFATAAVLCVGRIRPAARGFALSLAFAWILLVALSRLVLGVHWPTDVLAAACIGAFLPLAMWIALETMMPKVALRGVVR
jgi:undecaprenyl-diphosphatase